MNSPAAVDPNIAIPFSSNISHIESRFRFTDKKIIANVGENPSAMLFANSFLIYSGDLPFIDFAFIFVPLIIL